MEYKYRIPLGRSFSDYLEKQDILQDGLNNRRNHVSFNDLKSLNFDSNIVSSLRSLWKKKLTESKEIELEFDGLLIIRVYNEAMPIKVKINPGTNWMVPVGLTRNKSTFKYHDFEIFPHLTLGGATRYGKSNFINCIIIIT